jgi:hypothetical protein
MHSHRVIPATAPLSSASISRCNTQPDADNSGLFSYMSRPSFFSLPLVKGEGLILLVRIALQHKVLTYVEKSPFRPIATFWAVLELWNGSWATFSYCRGSRDKLLNLPLDSGTFSAIVYKHWWKASFSERWFSPRFSPIVKNRPLYYRVLSPNF